MDIATHGPTPASADRSWLGSIDRAVGGTVERIAAVLVAAEIVILFAGVVSRYLLHRPLTWSDELASTLFLWLAMFGSVIAIRQNAHMRMTALVGKLTPARRDFFEALATAAALAFCLLIASAALEYAYEESFITTPALELSGSWRASAFPVGIVLMTVFCLLRLATSTTVRHAIGAVALTAAIIAAFWLLGPSFKTLGNLNLIVFFVLVVMAAVFAGVPIGYSFALATFGYLALTTRVPTMVMVGRMDEGMSHLILLAVPLFVFLGLLIEMTGMARAMVQFLASLLGHVRGGLSYVLIGAMYLVSGISGSKAADMAAVAPALFPEMRARGAKPGDLVALLSATGAQTETIPPSIVLITIGSVTGVSIAALFTGGMVPGLVLAVGLCFVVANRYRNDDLSQVKRASAADILRTFVIALPALALPFVIRAAVVEGVATATEVSTIGIAYAIRRRPPDLSPVRLASSETHAHRDGDAVGLDPFHYRRGLGHGLGPYAIGLLAHARQRNDGAAGRGRIVHDRVDRRLCRPGQRARGYPGHCPLRPAALSDCKGCRDP